MRKVCKRKKEFRRKPELFFAFTFVDRDYFWGL